MVKLCLAGVPVLVEKSWSHAPPFTVQLQEVAAPGKNASPRSATSTKGGWGAIRGSPGAGQSRSPAQHRPSSAQPLQSLSSLSHASPEGPIDPEQSFQPGNSVPTQVWVPSVHAPTLRLPGGP